MPWTTQLCGSAGFPSSAVGEDSARIRSGEDEGGGAVAVAIAVAAARKRVRAKRNKMHVIFPHGKRTRPLLLL